MSGKTGSQSDAALTDEQLMGRYRAGHVDAYEQLVERYRQELFHFLSRFVGNGAAAEDMFQEAFLQVHLSAESFDISRRFKPWLFTIAANKARDYLRMNNRRRALQASALSDPTRDGAPGLFDVLEANLPLPSEDAESAEQQDMVRQVVAQMPDHLREVLVLAYFNQFAYKEVAEILSIPLGTVKSRLHAAVGTFGELWRCRYTPGGDER
jgi:RNA polymerase sigma-70 factor (ECF subfamily)